MFFATGRSSTGCKQSNPFEHFRRVLRTGTHDHHGNKFVGRGRRHASTVQRGQHTGNGGDSSGANDHNNASGRNAGRGDRRLAVVADYRCRVVFSFEEMMSSKNILILVVVVVVGYWLYKTYGSKLLGA